MKTRRASLLLAVFCLGFAVSLEADPSARVTEAVNQVNYGSKGAGKSPASVGTEVRDGQFLETESQSRAALLLPTTSITRLGSNTVFNYSSESNTIDLQQGTILFCKPKGASDLNIMTAGISAGITGTTGFVSITGEGSKKTYIFGIIEGHATAHADEHPFLVGSGEILEFKGSAKPFLFAFDLPRFVKSSPLLHRFKGTLPNQSYIDKAVADYEDDVSRGFIVTPSKGIDYSGDIPIYLNPAYDSAQSAQGQAKGAPPATTTSNPYRGGGYGGGNNYGGGSPSYH